MKSHPPAPSLHAVPYPANHRRVILKLADERAADGMPRKADLRHLDPVAKLLSKRSSGSTIRPLYARVDPTAVQRLMSEAVDH
jgi:hypothetical protein